MDITDETYVRKEVFLNYILDHRREHDKDATNFATRLGDMRMAYDKIELMRIEHEKERQIQLDGKLYAMNEIRKQLNDQARTFASSEITDSLKERLVSLERTSVERFSAKEVVDGIDKRLDVIEKANANFQGRLWAMGVGISAVVIMINIAIKFLG